MSNEQTKSPACRQEDESVEDCVNRKVPEIMEENPEMDQDQAVAIAYDVCETPCDEKGRSMKKGNTEVLKKIIGVPLKKEMTKSEDGTLLVLGYFTSDRKDEIGDIITRGATERALPKYKQWGNIRYMHQPRPVGKVTRIGVEDGLDWNEVEIKVIDPQAVFEVENGLLQALSVGILIKWDDIDFLDDGGWIINDYALAEISLVDHPANYDAHLKDINDELRMLIREYGYPAMKDYVKKEFLMMENNETDAIEEEPLEEEEVKDITEPAEEEEKEMPESEEKEFEEEEDEPIEEKSMEEEKIQDEDENDIETGKDITEEEDEEVEKDLSSEPEDERSIDDLYVKFDDMLKAITQLGVTVEEFSKHLVKFSEALETETEAHEASEDVTGKDETEKQIDVEDEHDEEPGAPVDRKGYVPETELPSEEDVDEAEKSEKEVTSLRSALRKHFENK